MVHISNSVPIAIVDSICTMNLPFKLHMTIDAARSVQLRLSVPAKLGLILYWIFPVDRF